MPRNSQIALAHGTQLVTTPVLDKLEKLLGRAPAQSDRPEQARGPQHRA